MSTFSFEWPISNQVDDGNRSAADARSDLGDVVEILFRFAVQNVLRIQGGEPAFFMVVDSDIFQLTVPAVQQTQALLCMSMSTELAER